MLRVTPVASDLQIKAAGASGLEDPGVQPLATIVISNWTGYDDRLGKAARRPGAVRGTRCLSELVACGGQAGG